MSEEVLSTSVPGQSIFDTIVSDTDPLFTESNPKSFTSVNSTPIVSAGSTVWTLSPIGYVECGCPPITEEDRQELSKVTLDRLLHVAAGRGETLEQVVEGIIQFFSDTDSRDLLEGDLREALSFYAANYVIE